MGHEPNIRLGFEDLPRPSPKPAAPGRWAPERPGDLGGPEEVPWGGAFGTPAPDIGFAIRIVRRRDLPGGNTHRTDVEAAVVAVMAARASTIGRAPMVGDVDAAIELLGLSEETAHEFAGIAHDHGRLRALVAAIPRDRLA